MLLRVHPLVHMGKMHSGDCRRDTQTQGKPLAFVHGVLFRLPVLLQVMADSRPDERGFRVGGETPCLDHVPFA